MVERSDEEQAWIARSREGDQQAFEALVLRYQRMIFALTYRMTGSPTEAEDLTQETFIAAFHQLDSFRGDSKFSSWLYRIAMNLCLNWRKSDQRRHALHRQWSEELVLAAEEESTVPAGEVQRALLKLNPRQRAAIVLTTYDGLTHAEAAEALGCSEATISWRVFAARARLKKALRNLNQTK